ncbi:MAG TPA: DUF485 domain-containing protein [Gammaproteobacteria bacterium]
MDESREEDGGGRGRADPDGELYRSLHASAEFQTLRRRYRAFAFPATAVFLGWYLLYVVLSSWAKGFMSIEVLGNVNVALVLGLLQFVSTFAIAWLYARHADRELDPIARRLERRYDEETGR